MNKYMKKRLMSGHKRVEAVTMLVHIQDCADSFVCFPEKVSKPDLFYKEGDLSVPAGHIKQHKNETPFDTAVRELMEETNVAISHRDLSVLGTYSFFKSDWGLVHVTALEGQVSDEQWTKRFTGVELFRPVDLVWCPSMPVYSEPSSDLRMTTIYPTLLLKYGHFEQSQKLLEDYGMPTYCAIHHEEQDRNIYIEPVKGALI